MKIISFQEEAEKRLKSGVDKLAAIVTATLGPKGKLVMYEKYGQVNVVDDGVTIADEIELEDEIENLGARLLKQAAKKTNELAGDGTTTSIALSSALISEGMKMTARGVSGIELKLGMEKALHKALIVLKSQSRKVEDTNSIESVATVSAGDNKIGKLIASAMDKMGKDGVITVQEGRSTETVLEIVEGMELDRGYISPSMVSSVEKSEFFGQDVSVLVTDQTISTIKQIVNILELYSSSHQRPLVIFAEDVKGVALSTLVLNRLQQQWNIVAVKAPSFGDNRKEILEDIAILTGAEFLSKDKGANIDEPLSREVLGSCESIKVTADKTVLIVSTSSNIELEDRKKQLRAKVEQCTSDYERDRMKERLAKLGGGVGVIKVGAATETEMRAIKFKIEDALNATKAAIEEGIVAGGGVALVNILRGIQNENWSKECDSDDIKLGVDIFLKSLSYPLKKIAENSGLNGGMVFDKVWESNKENFGFDAKNGEYKDVIKAGIIDPAKVTRASLQNAVSVAGMFLCTCAVIGEKKGNEVKANEPLY